MKKWLLFVIVLLAPWPAHAQTIPATANLTASDSGACTTANACLAVNITPGSASAVVQLTGTWSATVQFEGTTSNGGTFVSVLGTVVGSTSTATSATANGAWRFTASGLAQIRVRVSAYTSGTVAAAITSSTGSSGASAGGGGGFTAGGDLSGSSSSQEVIGVLNNALPALTTGSLGWNGSNWIFGSTAPNTNAFYLSQNCGSQANCTAVVSGHIAVNATFTSGMATLTTASTDPAFTCPGGTFPCSSGGDVGAVEFATYGCINSNPAQCNSANAQGTISSIQSAHAATVSSNFTHSSGSNTSQNANDFIWGPLEDTPISTAWSAAEALGGGTIVLPCNATLLISTPPFIRASATGPVQAMDVQGCPTTNLVPVPNFALASCNNGCIYYDAVAPGNNYLNGGASRQPTIRDLNIYGGGYDCTGCTQPGGAVAAIYLDNQSAYNVNVTGWDWNIAGFAGFDGGNLAQFSHSTSYAAGGIGCTAFASSNQGPTNYIGTICNSTIGLKVSAGQVFTNDSFFFDFGANGEAYWVTGGTAFSINDFIYGTAYVNGGVGHFSNDYVGGADLGGIGGFYVRANGSKAYLQNVWDNGGVGFTMGDSGGGTPVMYDLGGNVSTAAVNIASGNLFGSASITGTVQTSGNISPSTGWGSGTVGTVSGASRAEQFTITTGASGQTANPTVTVTFPAAFWVTPICVVPPNAGNDLIADSVITATSKTAVTFQWNGTPNPSKTYTFTVQCQNP